MPDNWQHQPELYCCYCGKLGTTYRKWWDDIHCTNCDGELPKEPDVPKRKPFLDLTHSEKMIRSRKLGTQLLRRLENAHYCTFVNERTGEVMLEEPDVG